MLRFVLSAVYLAGAPTTAQLALAHPCAATASDHVQAAAAAMAQPAPSVPGWSSSSDAPAPVSAGLAGKDIAPVGFGWG